jgi:small subunit ribosomal protein S17
MAEKKTTSRSSRPAKTAAAATKKPAAAKKPAARRTTKKAAAPEAAPKVTRKVSAARALSKAERPAPERVPGRKERRGVVVSSAMDKTVVVRIDSVKAHDLYGKVVRRSRKLHVHDEQNAAGVGDLVRVVETRPLSATKRWRLLEILEKAK